MSSTRYSASPRTFPHSSDTEQLETPPPRKRFRTADDDESPSHSHSPLSSSRKRQRRDTPKKQAKVIDLEQILRDCVAEPASHATILLLKGVPKDESSVRCLVKRIMHSAKCSVMSRSGSSKKRLLETELYIQWLNELDYVISGLEIALAAKMPGTRKRVSGLGRASYTVLYNLVDEFIDEVNAHHDGWSTLSSEPCLYPLTMSLVEEAKDPSTDNRSDEAVRLAEGLFKNIDKVMADAVRRYKVECGRNNPNLASKISEQEHALAKGCCLLCEQTGYGADDNDMGDTLMEETRDIMMQWKNEYEDCEDQLVDSDADSSS